MLRFLVLSWNVEEKAFGLLGEPPEGSRRSVGQHSQPQDGGCLRTWSCKSLELVLEPVEEQDVSILHVGRVQP